MQRTRIKPITPAGQPLVLNTADGHEILTVSPEIAEQLRYMVGRNGKTGELPRKLALISALSGDGVTFTSFALASVLTHDLGKTVCIVDLNWYSPSSLIPVDENKTGLAAILNDETTLDQALQKTDWPSLSYLPAGQVPLADRPTLARSPKLAQVIEDLAGRYDHLLLDIPAILTTSDALALAGLADTCCLVIRQGATPDHDVQKALTQAEQLKVMGVVLNQVKFTTPAWLRKAIAGN